MTTTDNQTERTEAARIGRHLRQLVDSSGLSTREVAQAARMDERDMRTILAGNARRITAGEFARICRAVDVKPSTVIADIDARSA